jgi:probable HAF family extracellular repeat protein
MQAYRSMGSTLASVGVIAAVIGVTLAVAPMAWAAKDTFTATQVDQPYGEHFFSGVALNNSGAVVGVVSLPDTTYWYTGANGVGVYSPPLPTWTYTIYGINDGGQVVGWYADSYFAPRHAYVTGPDGGYLDLHDASLLSSEARAINLRGQVAGNGSTATGTRAFTSDRQNTRLRPLGSLGGHDTHVTAMNNRGVVVGWSNDPASGAGHAFVTGPNGRSITDLGTLGGADSTAWAVNAKGQVVGWSTDAGGVIRAFISAADGLSIVDVSTLGDPRGFTARATAYGIDRSGHVVGYGIDTTRAGSYPYRAFITGRNGVNMRNLNDLVTLPKGSRLYAAKAINDRGQILAEDVDYDKPLWLLTPTRRTWEDELDDATNDEAAR